MQHCHKTILIHVAVVTMYQSRPVGWHCGGYVRYGFDVEGQEWFLKPMNCPHHIKIYASV